MDVFSLLSLATIALIMTDKNFLLLDERFLTFQEIEQYLRLHLPVAVTTSAQTKIEQCRAYLDQKMADTDTPYYGINTGFGFCKCNHW